MKAYDIMGSRSTLLGQVQVLQRQIKRMQEERKAQEAKYAAEMTAVGAQLKLFGDCLIASGNETDGVAAAHADDGQAAARVCDSPLFCVVDVFILPFLSVFCVLVMWSFDFTGVFPRTTLVLILY